MSNLKEYIVTLKEFNDLEIFYNDMENNSSVSHVPDRKVELVRRRSISKNTHYYLNEEEVNNLKKDPRVLSIELNYIDAEIAITPSSTIFNTTIENSTQFDKAPSEHQNDINWGLLASNTLLQSSFSSWGSDATTSQSGNFLYTSTGRNVDVVIVDGIMVNGHPEFDNYDSPGTTRYIRHDWYQYNTQLGITGFTGKYPYTTFESDSNITYNDHGTHTAGVVAGFLQGWAKNANIYNLYPYDTSSNYSYNYMIDWIRAFHRNKLVNPATGVKNPTVVNISFNLTKTIPVNLISAVVYRGVTYNKPIGGWGSTLVNYGIPDIAYTDNTYTNIIIGIRSGSMDVDIRDAINEGIIFCGAAGNLNTYIDIPSGNDYNNNLIYNGAGYYYHQGSSPGSSPNVICVGAVDSTATVQKTIYSNMGPRVDVFAPGANIMGPYKTAIPVTTTTSRYFDTLDFFAYNSNLQTNPPPYGPTYIGSSIAIYGNGFIRPMVNPNAMPWNYSPSPPSVPIFVFNQNDRASTVSDNYIKSIVPCVVFTPGTNAAINLKVIIAAATSSWGGTGSYDKSIPTYIAISWASYLNPYATNSYTYLNTFYLLNDLTPNTWTDIQIPIPDSVIQSNFIVPNESLFYIKVSQWGGNALQLWALDASASIIYDQGTTTTAITDERNKNFNVHKIGGTGTSTAAAQVTGVLASSAEVLNHINQAEARNIINKFSAKDQLYNPAFDTYNNVETLHGANNKYLYRRLERPLSGQVYPKEDYDPSYTFTSVSFPRPLIRRVG